MLLHGFTMYLSSVRKLKDSSIKHYFDALKWISKKLKDEHRVNENIYEVHDLDTLHALQQYLMNDPEFIALNHRGNNMYQVGLNHYVAFCDGYGFNRNINLTIFDSPISKPTAHSTVIMTSQRSDIIRFQCLAMADYQCALDASHQTFIAKSTKHPYMESHHLIPLKYQDKFEFSLDVYANFVCLCPVCHRRLHYVLDNDRIDVAKQLFINEHNIYITVV